MLACREQKRSEASLSLQRVVPFRRAVAVVCMVLAAMLSAQAYISLMDRIDHAHGHAHFANPLAGGVELKLASHSKPSKHHHAHGSGDHHHSQEAADHQQGDAAAHHAHGSSDHQHSHGTADHQHGGDAALVFLAAQSFVLPASPIPAFLYETGSPKLVSFRPRGPDHPPKSGPEIRV